MRKVNLHLQLLGQWTRRHTVKLFGFVHGQESLFCVLGQDTEFLHLLPRSRNGLMAWAVTINKKILWTNLEWATVPFKGGEREVSKWFIQILLHAVSVRAKEQGMLATIWVTSYILNISSLTKLPLFFKEKFC